MLSASCVEGDMGLSASSCLYLQGPAYAHGPLPPPMTAPGSTAMRLLLLPRAHTFWRTFLTLFVPEAYSIAWTGPHLC